MLLAYSDESYDASRYWIAAVVCTEHQVNPLMNALDDVVRKASASYGGIAHDAELHGYELFHGEGSWTALHTKPRARIGIYDDALEAIAAIEPLIFIRGVNIPGLVARYAYPQPPHSVVLWHLLERIDEYAEAAGELALAIADELDEAAAHRRQLWEFQRYSTPGYRARQLTRILDTIHFAPSHASRLLQAADLVAFLHKRVTSRVDTDDRAKKANGLLWDRIAPLIQTRYCWHP